MLKRLFSRYLKFILGGEFLKGQMLKRKEKMKVYVITQGAYSDYHIIGVALDKEKAERIASFFDSDSTEIEEYDTERWDISDGRCLYTIRIDNGRISIIDNDEFYDTNVVRAYPSWNVYEVSVMARDKEHAMKIASDMIAQYKAEKMLEKGKK